MESKWILHLLKRCAALDRGHNEQRDTIHRCLLLGLSLPLPLSKSISLSLFRSPFLPRSLPVSISLSRPECLSLCLSPSLSLFRPFGGCICSCAATSSSSLSLIVSSASACRRFLFSFRLCALLCSTESLSEFSKDSWFPVGDARRSLRHSTKKCKMRDDRQS